MVGSKLKNKSLYLLRNSIISTRNQKNLKNGLKAYLKITIIRFLITALLKKKGRARSVNHLVYAHRLYYISPHLYFTI